MGIVKENLHRLAALRFVEGSNPPLSMRPLSRASFRIWLRLPVGGVFEHRLCPTDQVPLQRYLTASCYFLRPTSQRRGMRFSREPHHEHSTHLLFGIVSLIDFFVK